MTTLAITTPDLTVGPCGCPACEKYADCDYCGNCTPEAEAPASVAEMVEADLDFGAWLATREDEQDAMDVALWGIAAVLGYDDED